VCRDPPPRRPRHALPASGRSSAGGCGTSSASRPSGTCSSTTPALPGRGGGARPLGGAHGRHRDADRRGPGWEAAAATEGPAAALELATARVRQASGAEFTVTFFNQNWREKASSRPGTVAAFGGEVKRFRKDLQLPAPTCRCSARPTPGSGSTRRPAPAASAAARGLPGGQGRALVQAQPARRDGAGGAAAGRRLAAGRLAGRGAAAAAGHRDPGDPPSARPRGAAGRPHPARVRRAVHPPARAAGAPPPAGGGGRGTRQRPVPGGWAEVRRVAAVRPDGRAARAFDALARRPRGAAADAPSAARATSAPARPSSRCGRCSARSTGAGRRR
jgi:hypothetical protein